MTRIFYRIARIVVRATVLAILLLGAAGLAYVCFHVIVTVGAAIASAWHKELSMPLVMLLAGAGMCLLAGALLDDGNRTNKDQKTEADP